MNWKAFFLPMLVRVLLYVFGGIMAKAGYDESQKTAAASGLAEFCIAGGAIILTMLWSWIAKIKVADKATKIALSPPADTPAKWNSAGLRSFGFVLIAASLTLAIAGCSSKLSPAQRADVVLDTYTATLNVLADAREAGKIDDATAEQIEVVRAAVRPKIDDLWNRRDEPGIVFDAAERAAFDSLVKLMEYRSRLENKPPPQGE